MPPKMASAATSGPDRVADLVPGNVRAPDVERQVGVRVAGQPALPGDHVRGQPGQLPLEGRDPGGAVGQPGRDPRVAVEGQRLPGRAGRQDGEHRRVGGVDQHRRQLDDRGDPEGLPDDGADRAAVAVPHERVGDLAAEPGVQRLDGAGGDHDLAGGRDRRQPPGQHRHLVLGPVLAVQAAVQRRRGGGPVDPAADHRRGGQPQVGGAGGDPGQLPDQPDRPQHRLGGQLAGHVHEHVAGPDRGEIPVVGPGRAPRPRDGAQRHRAEQPGEQGQRDGLPPGRLAWPGATSTVLRSPASPLPAIVGDPGSPGQGGGTTVLGVPAPP